MGAEKPAPRVLVVDDEAAVRTLAERVLRDAGYDVVTVSDGPEALAAAMNNERQDHHPSQ
jgi:CheY-like chemotaxis protein